jgi:hypothetical protein
MDKLFVRTPSQKTFTKLGLVEWLKVKALSSSPSTAKKKKKEKEKLFRNTYICTYGICKVKILQINFAHNLKGFIHLQEPIHGPPWVHGIRRHSK